MALAAARIARIAREMIRAALLSDGWTLLHASAVVRDGKTVLTFGSKGAGKTTTALLLASCGLQLLASARAFIRPDADGLQVLPWPSAAAIGLGLLDALGLYDVVRDRLKSGEQLHPTQHQDVTDALLAGRREPLWEAGGNREKREKKVQVFPDQFDTWFGMTLATGGTASTAVAPIGSEPPSPTTSPSSRTTRWSWATTPTPTRTSSANSPTASDSRRTGGHTAAAATRRPEADGAC
ncbi:hypothetical protein ACWY4P_46935 [Streptomyces sp. LZ34]